VYDVFRGTWTVVASKDLLVGDVVKVDTLFCSPLSLSSSFCLVNFPDVFM
jgi:magnesium-transporting ATPase (P-type)